MILSAESAILLADIHRFLPGTTLHLSNFLRYSYLELLNVKCMLEPNANY